MTDTVGRLSTAIEVGIDIDDESADDLYKSSKRDNEEEIKSVETSLEDEPRKCKDLASDILIKGLVPLSGLTSLYDFITDLQLIYKIQENKSLWMVLVLMVVSVMSPYLVAYSCGAQLYLNRGVFDKFA